GRSGLTRRSLLLSSGACAACAAVGYGLGRAQPPSAPATLLAQPATHTTRQRGGMQPDAIFRVDTDKPLVGLSFDDGPDPRYTPRVLDALDRHGAKATFFRIGVNALAYADP